MINFTTITLGFTVLTTALITGLFYAYSCSVNPGLGKLPDREYLAAMQSINLAIINPAFMLSFMGTLILLPVTTCLHFAKPLPVRFILLCIASLIYITGTFGTTIFGNVPLNDALANFDISTATIHEISEERSKFEQPWNRLHSIRTLSALAAFSIVIIACLFEEKNI